jgi:hypothetical protein
MRAALAYRKQISVFTRLFAYHRPQFPPPSPLRIFRIFPYLPPPPPAGIISMAFRGPGAAVSSRLRRAARTIPRYSIPAFPRILRNGRGKETREGGRAAEGGGGEGERQRGEHRRLRNGALRRVLRSLASRRPRRSLARRGTRKNGQRWV